MSLLKRLLLTVSVAILIILSGTLALSIQSARQYLDGQLQSQSENAVSALALSLSQPANQDAVTRELLMMALFDSGQFRAIRLTGTDGQVLFERSNPDTHGNGAAPAWFARLLPLRVPEAVRAINDGWTQVGNLSVTVDNTFARDALWSSSIRMGLLVLVAGGLWALSVVGLLHWFGRVLREEISAQVMAIGATALPGAGTGPRRSSVAELSAVVDAISDTRERVRATAQEHTQRIESLEVEINRDPVTLLPNRKYFMNELRRVLQGEPGADGQTAPVGGHVLLFRQRDLQALNTCMTRGPADAWLTSVTERVGLTLTAGGRPDMLLARLNGSDFIALMPRLEGQEAMHLVQQIRQELQALRQPIGSGQWCRWAYALTDYDSGVTVSELLSRLDQALMRSESVGQEEVEYLTDAAPRNTVSELQWQQTLQQALEQERLQLQVTVQRYASAHGEAQRHEASLMLQEAEGSLLQGALFLPVAVRLGMSAAFDLRAMRLGQQWLQQHPGAQLVVKVSLPSLADETFLPQLRALWAQEGDWPQRLWVELDAHGLVAYPEEMEALATAAAAGGAHMGLRRLEQEPMALARLHRLPLAYVKLGSDFVRQSTTSPGSRHLLQAMVATARALEIQVYLTDCVDAELAQALLAQGVQVPLAQDS